MVGNPYPEHVATTNELKDMVGTMLDQIWENYNIPKFIIFWKSNKLRWVTFE